MGYFVPKDKKLKYKPGDKPTLAESERQLNETAYYQYFERNKFEHEIREEYMKMMAADDPPETIVKVINKKLGYEMFYVDEGKVERFFDYEKEEHPDAKTARLLSGLPPPKLPWSMELTYANFGKRYIHKGKRIGWKRYTYLTRVSTRLPLAYPGNDYFYLRILMSKLRGMKHVDELLLCPNGVKQPNFKMSCLAWGFIDDSTEYFIAMHEANMMGLYGQKLLGFFCSIITEGDATNIREIWDGHGLETRTRPLTDEEKLYPKGMYHLMAVIPPKIKKQHGNNLLTYPSYLRRDMEQFTLRKLAFMLEKEGCDYPEELPKLTSENNHMLTEEYIEAHRHCPTEATETFNKNYASTNS